MSRLIKITSHSSTGKLYVDLIPRNTILKVAAEGDDVWFIDATANGLGVFDSFILIPKQYAKTPSHLDVYQRALPFAQAA